MVQAKYLLTEVVESISLNFSVREIWYTQHDPISIAR